MTGKRVGVFGGTFDPPHVGHQILAMEASDQLLLDTVLWVLAPDPPHKQGKGKADMDIRIQMVKLAIQDDCCFELSSVDINRPGPHYVVDTMRLLHLSYPNDELIFLMGGDSLHDLLTWYDPVGFIQACDRVGVMRRPGEDIQIDHLEEKIPELASKLEFIDAPLLEISSNQIRQLIANRQPYRYYLPASIYNFIENKSLYRGGKQNA